MSGKNLATEAVNDVKSMVDLALEAAKTELVEQMAPELKKLLEKNLREKNSRKLTEDSDRVRRIEQGYPGESKNKKFEESTGEGSMDYEKDMDESLANFFAPIAEEDEEKDDMDESQVDVPVLEADKEDDDDMKAEAKDEDDVEISEDALREVYESALKTEVKVKSGFGDFTKGGDFGKEKPDSGGGILDIKNGEQDWDDVEPPAKQDFTVKEIRQMIAKGIEENRQLRAKVAKLQEACQKLYEQASTAANKLQEVNLFNSKLLHVTRFLNTHGRLSNQQKKTVVERIEKARSVSEVKMVYETIVETFKAAQGQLAESTGRKPVGNAQRPRQSGAPKQEVLSESVGNGEKSEWSRIQQLAGLKNIR